jgi:tetratricopeptide (TPR) repeat protein
VRLATDPNNSFVYWFLALALDADGKPDDALRTIQEAIRLDPALADLFDMEVGSAYLQEGQYQDAISAYERDSPSFSTILASSLGLAIAYTELGRDQDARAEAAEVIRLNPHFTLPRPELWNKNAAWGRRVDTDLRKAGLKRLRSSPSSLCADSVSTLATALVLISPRQVSRGIRCVALEQLRLGNGTKDHKSIMRPEL